MKKNLLNPNFEFIFALGIITMLMLPPIVMAQQAPKQLKVIIQNNDTTINGKNIKQLSASERVTALKDMADVSNDIRTTLTDKDVDHITYMLRRNDVDDGKLYKYLDTTRIAYLDPQFGRQIISLPNLNPKWIKEQQVQKISQRETFDMPTSEEIARSFRIRIDTSGNRIEPRIEEMKMQTNNRPMTQRFSFRNDDEGNGPHRGHRGGPGSSNSQSFSYSNVNKDGFSTQVNYNAGDVNKETAKKIGGVEKPELVIDDLMLNPSFSTGKTNLSFTLPEKGNAEVQFKDSEGKVLWTDKTSRSFYKSFELAQNGIYFLQVKQGSKIGLRQIVKEQ